MKRIENECFGCSSIGLPCAGSSCTHRNVVHFYCDKCKDEVTLYHYDDLELCSNCLLKEFEVVEGSDEYY